MGKASGFDDLSAEHLIHCHQSGLLCITYLCNLMLLTGYVPAQFGTGVTHPIPKSNVGNKNLNFDDFRGITISPVISKILEKGILENFGQYFKSSESQFGFKKKIGCNHAIYTLKSIVELFNLRDSTVNLCSLDISKAFDKLNHFALFLKLMLNNVPVNVILLLFTWYQCSVAFVKWNGQCSSLYRLLAGVRQGGVLSPILFAMLVDSLIKRIMKSNLGCHIGLLCISILMYADDLILVSASACDLQKMIDLCISELSNLDLQVNIKKSQCIRIGKHFNHCCSNLYINNVEISWSKNLTYLGIMINSSTHFSIDMKRTRGKFYRSFNAVYSKISLSNESLIVSLVKTCCVPALIYSLESINMNASSLNSLDEPLYNAMGKIFKTFDRVVLRQCMFYMNVLPLSKEYFCRKIKFLSKLNASGNFLLKQLFLTFGQSDLDSICAKHKIDNVFNARSTIWETFVNSLYL